MRLNQAKNLASGPWVSFFGRSNNPPSAGLKVKRVEGGNDHGDGDRERKLLIEPAGDPGNEYRGHEHRRKHQCDANYRAGQLLHGFPGRILRSQALFDVPLYAFDYDNGVVHHQTDRQHQSEERKGINREAEKGKTRKVPTSETGTASIGMMVARQSCRKR